MQNFIYTNTYSLYKTSISNVVIGISTKPNQKTGDESSNRSMPENTEAKGNVGHMLL